MITFTVLPKHNNLKILKVINLLYPQIPYSTLQKLLRKKDIKINGKRISENVNILSGDIIDIYWQIPNESINIIFEDGNLIAINKPQGIEVLNSKDSTSLLELVQKYLHTKEVYPCHRLDRNTGGIVLFAKNEDALKIIEEKIKTKEIRKFYKCRVIGHLQKKEATLNDYLFKDSKKSIVYISNEKKEGYMPISTKYSVIWLFVILALCSKILISEM